MSQKKVDAYKARKSTRGRADKKEKMMFTLEMFAWAFICVVVVAWIGYSAYVKVAGTKAEVVQNTAHWYPALYSVRPLLWFLPLLHMQNIQSRQLLQHI